MKVDMKRASQQAHEDFKKDFVRGLRRKRLAKSLHKGKKEEKPDADDLGGYDALQAEYDEKK